MARNCPFGNNSCEVSSGVKCALWNGKCAFVRIAESLEKLDKVVEKLGYINTNLNDIKGRMP